MILEILRPEAYPEYEAFVSSHPNGSLTQSTFWPGVKANWEHDIVVVRNEAGEIEAGVSVLVRKMPFFGSTLMYAPRGPVCDYNSPRQLRHLQAGIDQLAEKHNAYTFKMDPDVNMGETSFVDTAKEMGYTHFYDPTGFETIQTRFNYRVYIDGRDADELLMDLHSKTRYNIRLAGRRGVEIKVGTTDADLDEFMRLMVITGERDGFNIRSKEYFSTMLEALGEHLRLYLAFYEGQAIAGAICSNYGDTTSYIYGASDNEHRNTMATYLIQWEMMLWALETDCKIYDLMGISGDFSEDNPLYGLYRFKDGFGGQVDEAIGELDYVYKPVVNKLVNAGISLNERLQEIRRKSR